MKSHLSIIPDCNLVLVSIVSPITKIGEVGRVLSGIITYQ